jgi:hypothetical protein
VLRVGAHVVKISPMARSRPRGPDPDRVARIPTA